jgi:hypothetical protein
MGIKNYFPKNIMFILYRFVDVLGIILALICGIFISFTLLGNNPYDMLVALMQADAIMGGLFASAISGYIIGRLFQGVSYSKHTTLV